MKLEIKIPIYDCVCKVIIDKDIDKTISKYAKKFKWGAHNYKVHGLALNPENMKEYYIFYATDSLTVNIIVHEITHLVDFILEDRAIENEGEAKAYLTGFISEKVFDFILKKHLLINKWYKPGTDEKPSRLLREGDQDTQGVEGGSPRCGVEQTLPISD